MSTPRSANAYKINFEPLCSGRFRRGIPILQGLIVAHSLAITVTVITFTVIDTENNNYDNKWSGPGAGDVLIALACWAIIPIYVLIASSNLSLLRYRRVLTERRAQRAAYPIIVAWILYLVVPNLRYLVELLGFRFSFLWLGMAAPGIVLGVVYAGFGLGASRSGRRQNRERGRLATLRDVEVGSGGRRRVQGPVQGCFPVRGVAVGDEATVR